MTRLRTIKHALRDHAQPLCRPVMVPVRLAAALRHTCAGVGRALAWSVDPREDTNSTYELTPANLNVLVQLLALVTRHDPVACRACIEEVAQATESSQFRSHTDLEPRLARRRGWYALVRLTRPRVVVETGVDKGLGSALLCSALLRNRAEGHPGRDYGTDINPEAGKMLYGDSIASLQTLDEQVDVFINDSDHSAEYEAREYEVVASKLGGSAVVLSDNADVSDALERFSRARGRSYLSFHEQPLDYWYHGAGIGFSFAAPAARSSPP